MQINQLKPLQTMASPSDKHATAGTGTGQSKDASELERRYRQLLESHQQLQEDYDRLVTQKERMVQREKMASIGMLADGIAQEINNPIGFIRSNLETLQDYVERIKQGLQDHKAAIDRLASTSPTAAQTRLLEALEQRFSELQMEFIAKDSVASIEESLVGIRRVEGIIDNLRDFSRADSGERTLTDINEIIDGTLSLVWNQIKFACNVRKVYGDLPQIYAIGGQLRQVFVNVIMNAVQAFDQDDNTLEIHTRFENDMVIIEFADNGPGIPAEIVDKIFDPFFSTKEIIGGSGMGLYISHGVISSHRGEILVSSEPGKGARFTIKLPTDIRGAER